MKPGDLVTFEAVKDVFGIGDEPPRAYGLVVEETNGYVKIRWNDGKVRAFMPQSGKLCYAINDAHNHGVTALATTNDCQRIVTGGMEGEVRIWRIGRQT